MRKTTKSVIAICLLLLSGCTPIAGDISHSETQNISAHSSDSTNGASIADTPGPPGVSQALSMQGGTQAYETTITQADPDDSAKLGAPPSENPELSWVCEVNGTFDLRRSGWDKKIIETESSIYYVSDIGVHKIDKNSMENNIIAKAEKVKGMFLTDEYLYYGYDTYGYDKDPAIKIFRMAPDGDNEQLIWDSSKVDIIAGHFPYLDQLSYFAVYKDKLYIMPDGVQCILYDMCTKQTYAFPSETSSTYDVAFLGDNMFFNEYKSWAFTIKKMDLNTEEISLDRGDGISVKNLADFNKPGTLYWQFIVLGDKLYYATTDPVQIFEYDPNGNDRLVIDLAEYTDNMEYFSMALFCTSLDKLYFCIAENDYFDDKVYEYDPATDSYRVITIPGGFEHNDRLFAVANGALIYYTIKEPYDLRYIELEKSK